jgi:putative hydrolase of the HAD superfamily
MPQNNVYKPPLCDQFNASSHRTALVFDLDNTIVDISPLFGQMEAIYTDFLAQRLNISRVGAHREVIDMLKVTYYIQDEALRRHNIPIADTLQVTYDPQSLNFNALHIDPQIGTVLRSIFTQKYVFTNAPHGYAQALLTHLGIKDCFNGIAGTDDFQFMRKPEKACFDAFEGRYGLRNKEVHFFEDTPENLNAAHLFKGWSGHLVLGHQPNPPNWQGAAPPHYVCSQLDTLLDLRK